MVLVKKITAKDTYFLRKEVLRKGIDLPFMFEGDLDSNSFHIGVYENDELVCIGTFMNNCIEELEEEQYQLRGMATLPKSRGKGFGKILLNFATKKLIKQKINYVWCNAREIAVEFYKKNGFKIIGDQFLVREVGIHYKMYKLIKNENN